MQDWDYVDGLISSYESGRALDMRDALLQADSELRLQNLSSEIYTFSLDFSHNSQTIIHLLQNFESQLISLNKSISSLSKQVKRLVKAAEKKDTPPLQ